MFFENAIIILDMWENFREFVAEEQELIKSETGGITRQFCLAGFDDPAMKAAVMAKGLLCDFFFWPWESHLSKMAHVCDHSTACVSAFDTMDELAGQRRHPAAGSISSLVSWTHSRCAAPSREDRDCM